MTSEDFASNHGSWLVASIFAPTLVAKLSLMLEKIHVTFPCSYRKLEIHRRKLLGFFFKSMFWQCIWISGGQEAWRCGGGWFPTPRWAEALLGWMTGCCEHSAWVHLAYGIWGQFLSASYVLVTILQVTLRTEAPVLTAGEKRIALSVASKNKKKYGSWSLWAGWKIILTFPHCMFLYSQITCLMFLFQGTVVL